MVLRHILLVITICHIPSMTPDQHSPHEQLLNLLCLWNISTEGNPMFMFSFTSFFLVQYLWYFSIFDILHTKKYFTEKFLCGNPQLPTLTPGLFEQISEYPRFHPLSGSFCILQKTLESMVLFSTLVCSVIHQSWRDIIQTLAVGCWVRIHFGWNSKDASFYLINDHHLQFLWF